MPKALLLDLDGVLYVEDEPVAGAREAVAELRERGLALRFVTNTTSRPRRLILDRLRRLGFEVAPGELSTPAALAVAHCIEHDRQARAAARARRRQARTSPSSTRSTRASRPSWSATSVTGSDTRCSTARSAT